ncbi:MAG TPA: hypothetical protein PLQ00_03370, partial [Thermoguttaceae bacterium]|nr:hypothetical protein [Thermoguttaceae bacterium]
MDRPFSENISKPIFINEGCFMAKWRFWATWGVCVLGFSAVFTSELLADSPLDGDKLITALRPQHPVDKDFLTYTGALLEAGYLPRSLVESTF